MHNKPMKQIFEKNHLEILPLKKPNLIFQKISIYFVEVFHVKHFQLQEIEDDLKTREEHFFLKSQK